MQILQNHAKALTPPQRLGHVRGQCMQFSLMGKAFSHFASCPAVMEAQRQVRLRLIQLRNAQDHLHRASYSMLCCSSCLPSAAGATNLVEDSRRQTCLTSLCGWGLGRRDQSLQTNFDGNLLTILPQIRRIKQSQEKKGRSTASRPAPALDLYLMPRPRRPAPVPLAHSAVLSLDGANLVSLEACCGRRTAPGLSRSKHVPPSGPTQADCITIRAAGLPSHSLQRYLHDGQMIDCRSSHMNTPGRKGNWCPALKRNLAAR